MTILPANQKGAILLPVFFILLAATVGLLVYLGNQQRNTAQFSSMLPRLQARICARSAALFRMNTPPPTDTIRTKEDTITLARGSGWAACSTSGLFGTINAKGRCLAESASVTITRGGSLFTASDTVLFLTGDKPQGGMIDGIVAEHYTDSAQSFFDATRLGAIIKGLKPDTVAFEKGISTPLLIQSSAAASALPAVVRGDLLIDGSYRPVTMTARTVTVKGDLQITGSTRITGCRFSVNGEVRILDRAILEGVAIHSEKRIMVEGSTAAEHVQLTAQHSITLKDKATLIRDSFLGSFAEGDSSSGGISIYLEDNARFAGSITSVKGHIRIGRGATVQGVVLCGGNLSCAGMLEGIARVNHISDLSDGKATANTLTGRIRRFKGSDQTPLPWLFTKDRIIGWQEH